MHASQEARTDPPMITAIRGLSRSTDHLRHAYADAHAIYHTDFRALVLIHCAQQRQTPLTAGELASALELSSGAVTYLVERLSHAGLVSREVDLHDRRKVLLAATRKGHQLIVDYLSPMGEVIGAAISGYSEEQVATTLQMMAAIEQALDEHTSTLRSAGRPA